MPRPREIPEGAEVIRTYAALQWFLRAFAQDRFTLLIVVGRSGLSKSVSIKDQLKEKSLCYIQGHALPIQVYIELFKHRHEPVVLDDAEGLYEAQAGRNLLTNLTQTDQVKTLEWLSSSRILTDQGVPMRFSTTSRVCIITNRWSGSSKEIQALEDRGHLIYFDPTPDEVHRYVATWLQRDAQDVYDFVGENLHLIDRSSCRLYIKAMERKEADGDWREFVRHHCYQTAKQVVRMILEDPTCRTEKERVQKAKEQAGISRATYYRYKKELDADGQAPSVRPYKLTKLKLTAEPPSVVDLADLEARENRGPDGGAEGGTVALKVPEYRET
jgi:hypothetical protein